MKGLMVQEGVTMDEALKIMEEGQKVPDRPAPMLPPRVLGTVVLILILENNTQMSDVHFLQWCLHHLTLLIRISTTHQVLTLLW